MRGGVYYASEEESKSKEDSQEIIFSFESKTFRHCRDVFLFQFQSALPNVFLSAHNIDFAKFTVVSGTDLNIAVA
ncbi:MAG: hypothetical protein AAB390_01845, partial [Patescibacteria group bacterium]